MIDMWQDNSPPVFQLSQMMYGCGAIIGPLLVRPYVYGDLSNKTDYNTSVEATPIMRGPLPHIHNKSWGHFDDTIDEDINYSVDRRSRLRIPFMIGGALTLTSEC